MLTCRLIQQIINQHRIQHKIRILWPDYEVYDLLEQKINLEDIKYFTSNCISVVKIDNITEQLHQLFSDKAFTHMAMHKVVQLDTNMQLVDVFYAILSKRGLALDQLNCKFHRGNYLICAHIAQIDRQISLWGVQSITEEVKLIGPKSIVKKNTMWILQFESPKPLKSILLYSTKREPRYGKSSFIENQLPKDTKLQFCMKTKIFPSYLDSLMNKEEALLSDTFYLAPNAHKSIKFSKEKKQEGQQANHSLPKIKIKEDTTIKLSETPNKRQEQTMVKILKNSSFLQVLHITQPCQIDAIVQQIKIYINKAEQSVHELIKEGNKLDKEMRQIITCISFKEIQSCNWSQITKLTEVAKQSQIEQLYYFLFAVKIFIFCQEESTSISHWIEIYQHTHFIKDVQVKLKFIKWSKLLMVHYCLDLFKNCEDQVYEQLVHCKQLLIDCLTLALQKHQNENAKRSDLLYILMQIHGKRDIFDLYHNYRLTPRPILLASSLRNWQRNQYFYSSQSNSDVVYQTQILPQIIQYNLTYLSSLNSINKTQEFDFQIKFVSDLSSNNAFIAGKMFTVNKISFRYFLYRKYNDFYCFIEQAHPFSQSSPTQPQFTTYQIAIEMQVNNQTINKQVSWSFISPSMAVGSKFSFKQLPKNISLICKMSFRRNIIHDSILNYLRIRFQELAGLQNKCSLKIEQENKKLVKRRSSVFLQKSLLTADFHEKIQRQCFLHKYCNKCQSLLGNASIFHLNALDFYNLLLFAPFKQQLDALLIMIKYLKINEKQQINKHFWTSQIRLKYLNLNSLLNLINSTQVTKNTLQICVSLIDEKIKQSMLAESKKDREAVFVMNQSRIGLTMWQFYQEDYSQEYLIYITNSNSTI